MKDYKLLDKFYYDKELGAIYSKDETTFILWAPTASDVKLALYGKEYKDANEKPHALINMKKTEQGTWKYTKNKDLHGEFYNYIVTVDNVKNIVTDPYAKAVGVNGNVGMVVDLSKTNPSDWENDKKPNLDNKMDSIIYEIHIRDFSIDENSGIDKKGKFKGICEKNTTIPNTSIKTGISHLIELGINTVHLLPSFDFFTVDEKRDDGYNWGYDPQNYNVPEGSYSTNPYDGVTRIKEYKEMVQNLHKQGLRVVMDVVYNHTGLTEKSNLNLAVPNYYYRQNEEGGFSNASGCGNETASERLMVRKFIVDSVKYWASEYHVDGFRFDLMAIHDIETMKIIREELDKIDKSILIYGEGWNGGKSPLSKDEQSLKENIYKYENMQIAAFSDDIRDGIKGHVFGDKDGAFINGMNGFEEVIKFGVVASTYHPQIDYTKINYSDKPWANEPYQTITYASAHDNLTLWDKLQTVDSKATKEELISMNKLASAIVLTSQGIPFIHAGEELARTKINENGEFVHNSFNKGDKVNKIDWIRKEEYNELFDYYRGLIKIRKEHKAFRMSSSKDIIENIKFMEKGIQFSEDNVVGYTINTKLLNDTWEKIVVIFNTNSEDVVVDLDDEEWVVVVNDKSASTIPLEIVKNKNIKVKSKSACILVNKKSFI